VGDGPEAPGLKRLADEVAPGAVRFLGKQDAPERILKAGDLFFLPSQREGLSVALLEAMACGLVPVVSDLEPNRAVVEHGVTGLVFETDNQEALEDVIRTALSCDRHALRTAAAAQVRARNSLEGVASTHLALYRSLAEAPGPSPLPRRVL
jgi:glycosyltransferase involved in cell wall biosynthesis